MAWVDGAGAEPALLQAHSEVLHPARQYYYFDSRRRKVDETVRSEGVGLQTQVQRAGFSYEMSAQDSGPLERPSCSSKTRSLAIAALQ